MNEKRFSQGCRLSCVARDIGIIAEMVIQTLPCEASANCLWFIIGECGMPMEQASPDLLNWNDFMEYAP